MNKDCKIDRKSFLKMSAALLTGLFLAEIFSFFRRPERAPKNHLKEARFYKSGNSLAG